VLQDDAQFAFNRLDGRDAKAFSGYPFLVRADDHCKFIAPCDRNRVARTADLLVTRRPPDTFSARRICRLASFKERASVSFGVGLHHSLYAPWARRRSTLGYAPVR